MHYLFVAAFVGLVGYLLNSWVDVHALAVLTPLGQWEMAGRGWGGLGAIVLAGLLPGVVIGLFVGSRVGDLVHTSMTENQQATHDAQRAERLRLEAFSNELDGHIRRAGQEGRKEGAAEAQEAARALFETQTELVASRHREAALKGRLIGSQQKAARIKKSQLTSRDAAKPPEEVL